MSDLELLRSIEKLIAYYKGINIEGIDTNELKLLCKQEVLRRKFTDYESISKLFTNYVAELTSSGYSIEDVYEFINFLKIKLDW